MKKSLQRRYAKLYRENIDSGQSVVPEQKVIPERELTRESREVEAIPSRDSFFHDTSSPKAPNKLTAKEGPKLNQKEVNLKSESLQRGELHMKAKPQKKEVDLKKARKKAIKKQQYKRLHFDDEAINTAASYGSSTIHRKVSESSDDNTSVEAFNEGTKLGERGARDVTRKVSSLRFESQKDERNKNRERSSKESENSRYSDRLKFDDEETEMLKSDKPSRRKEQQKRAIKKQYAAKKRKEDTGSILTKKKSTATKDGGLGARLKEKVQNFLAEHKVAVAIVILIGLLIFIVIGSLTMCGSAGSGSTSIIFGTTYLASDEDILGAEEIYCGLEAGLQAQIDSIETTYPGYDEYRYQIDEISHDPYALISYLTVKYGEFTVDQVTTEINNLFSQQYTLNIWETTETRTREVTRTEERQVRNPRTGQVETQIITVTETEEYEAVILNVSLTNKGLDMVVFENLDEEEFQSYRNYQAVQGNRRYLFGEPTQTPTLFYEIPPEYLEDERFANMIREANKYLGYPYVFGGSSPSTSFDCSGFVSWVINHCGNGWNVGRLGATDLMYMCTIISPEEAQPGDLIFFENTYNCDGPASHVGIYVGDGMMIHCGKPIQYTSIETSYWQEHFLCFGRIP